MSIHNSSLLRNALFGNSIFCFISGVGFVLFSKPLSAFLGLSVSWVILVLGIVLAAYGVEVFTLARKDPMNRESARFVIGADLAWVVGSALLIFSNFVVFSNPGKWAVAIVADIVLVFAVVQYIGLRRMSN